MPILQEGERLDQVNEDIRLISKTRGLTFGTDAFLLASFVRPAPRGVAVELGTGTGIISLLCAARGRFARIHALEIQEDFATLAARNVILNGMTDRVLVRHCDLREVSSENFGGEAEAVFANPPYMRTDSGKRNDSEWKYIARHEVCGTVEDFCSCAWRLLKHGGKFYCVWRPDRLSELMASLTRNRLEPKQMVFVHGDPGAEPSMVLISATKGGAPGMRILPPLFLHDQAGDGGGARPLSERAARIYDTMNFHGAP
ncbi:MAG: methyltransferase [Clostridia bacterium]|nr:methyltransferase [Clostridia bacterium]